MGNCKLRGGGREGERDGEREGENAMPQIKTGWIDYLVMTHHGKFLRDLKFKLNLNDGRPDDALAASGCAQGAEGSDQLGRYCSDLAER